MGFMEREVLGVKSPLFGRRTAQLHMRPFDYLTSSEFLPGFSAQEKLLLYGVYGGTAMYLQQIDNAAKCLKYIDFLRELGIVYKEKPLDEKEKSRKTQYGICDPMFRFWFRYVSPNRTLLETGAQDIVLQKRIAPDLSQYMGPVFEKICIEYLLRKNGQGELPILFTETGRCGCQFSLNIRTVLLHHLIAAGDLAWIFARNCEGTEQLQ